MRSTTASSLAVAILAASSAALAQPPPGARALAEGLFRDGKKLLAQGRVPEACRKLEASYRAEAAPGTLLNLALCHEREGKTASAWVELSDVVAQAKDAPPGNRKSAERRKIAEQHLAAIEPRLARLSVQVAGAARAPSLKVTLGDLQLDPAAFGTAFPIDPGEHTLSATAPGKAPWKTAIRVEDAEGLTVVIPPLADLPAPTPAAPAASPVQPARSALERPAPADAGRGAWMLPVGISALGLGAVGLGLGSYFGARALALAGEARDLGCRESTCPTPEALRRYKDGASAARGADISLGLGVAFAAAGLVLVIAAPRAHAPRALAAAPILGPGIALGTIGGSF